MSENLLTYVITSLIVLVPLVIYLARLRRRDQKAQEAAKRGQLYKVGVSFGQKDITLEASLEAEQERAAKQSALR